MKPDDARTKNYPLTIDPTLSFTRAIAVKAHEHWLSLKRGRAMPARSDITPSVLREVLPHIALVDVPRPGDLPSAYVTRLAGDAIQRVFGPLTGRPIHELMPPDILSRWLQCFDAVRNSGAPVRAASRISFQNKSWLQSEVFLAPLGDDGVISTIFGAIDTWPADEAR